MFQDRLYRLIILCLNSKGLKSKGICDGNCLPKHSCRSLILNHPEKIIVYFENYHNQTCYERDSGCGKIIWQYWTSCPDFIANLKKI